MVIVEELPDGGAVLRGRDARDVIEVPRWPCSSNLVRKNAVGVSSVWLDEACAFANAELGLGSPSFSSKERQ